MGADVDERKVAWISVAAVTAPRLTPPLVPPWGRTEAEEAAVGGCWGAPFLSTPS